MTSTRRSFLATAGALASMPFAAGPAGSAEADTGQQAVTALEVRPASLRLRADGPETSIIRSAGSQPLPILRVKQGDPIAVPVSNHLAEPMSLQWQGLRGVGTAIGPLRPGAEAVLEGRFADAGTYWFRAEPDAADLTARGLFGVLIVDASNPAPVDHDLVLCLSDWRLDEQNRIVADAATRAVTVMAVNGTPAPASWTFRPSARLRVRLLNASTRRVMVVAVEGARPLIWAIDGQPSELFEPLRGTVTVGPGARFDYVVDLPREPAQTLRFTLKGMERSGDTLEADQLLATLLTGGEPFEPRGPVAPLPPNPALPREIRLEAAKRAELALEQHPKGSGAEAIWTVNGVSGAPLPNAPILKVKRGDAVSLGFTNKSPALVPLRISGQAVRLLHSKDDGWDPYWRESVLLPTGARAHVAFVADTPGRWTIESGFDAQASAGLRCWFEVTPP